MLSKISKTITHNQINRVYDNNLYTTGSFYSTNEEVTDVEFDLGNNHLIEYVLIKMKRENIIQRPSFSVGNSFKAKGGLFYDCEIYKESEDFYKCKPLCQPGIFARKIILKLKVSSEWISIYEIQVFSKYFQPSSDISSNRLVQPVACHNQSWLLTDRATNASMSTKETTYIYFEISYIITDIIIKFNNSRQDTFNMSMVNENNKTKAYSVSLSDCSLQRYVYSCKVGHNTFPTRYVVIITTDLLKLFINGKAVFSPKLEIKTSVNMNSKLRMTCIYSECDESVHGICSDEMVRNGVKFKCIDKQLIRDPSGEDSDSYYIVNHGKVNSVWNNTKFSVEVNKDNEMVVSMPRSYQYFGQYRCGCIIDDELKSEITSNVTQLSEVDFLEELIFDKKLEYKSEDSVDEPFQNAINDVIFPPQSKIVWAYVYMRVSVFSLMDGNNLSVYFYTKDNDNEKVSTDKSTRYSVKAFLTIPQSWSVPAYKYVLDEIFADFVHDKDVVLLCTSARVNITQKFLVKILDKNVLTTKPAIWSNDADSKMMRTNIMYASKEGAKLQYSETGCLGTKTIVLATFTDNTCRSNDPRLTCNAYQGATFLSFKVDRNFAKTSVIDVVDTATDRRLGTLESKGNFTLNQEDIVIQSTYTNLQLPRNEKEAKTLRVEFKIISKKIIDFIPCGNVVVEVLIPKQPKQMMIITTNIFAIDIQLLSAKFDIVVTVSISNVPGRHVTNVTIDDPTTLSPSNVEFQGDKELSIHWNGVDEITGNLMQSYEVIIISTTVACSTTDINTSKIPKSQTNRYKVAVPTINTKHLTNMSVTVQPVYVGGMRGQLRKLIRQSGTIRQSDVIVDNTPGRTHRSIVVKASQQDLPCGIKDTIFDITGVDVDKFQWNSESKGNMTYNVSGLVPGRKYRLTAKVRYLHGPEDDTSQSYTFDTADDVSILQQTHVAQINDYVNITCWAEIGPDDKFRKSVLWLRSDKSLLPDGVKSVLSPFNPKITYLVMEKASADYSGEYTCFAYPPANSGWMSISIVVNDLDIFPIKKRVNFSDALEMVSVKCSTSAVGENNLIWIEPFGSEINRKPSAKYSIKNTVTNQNVHQSTLTITGPSIQEAGVYKCRKAIGNIRADKEFLLYGIEKLKVETLDNSSSLVGETRRLRCTANPGLRTQSVIWEIKSIEGDRTVVMNSSYPFKLDRTIQDLEMLNSLKITSVTCRLTPIIFVQLKETLRITFGAKIVVNGPTNVNAGTNVTLTCIGYPNMDGMQLMWVFNPLNKTTARETIVVSDKPSKFKSYEPLKLQLNITDVNNKEAGRYECRFKEDMGRMMPARHSINLVVHSVEYGYSKKTAQTPFHINHPIIFILATLTMYVSCNR